ncbi:MAG: hypothetical protein GPOALKHO_000376 [Sodalis sp.]|nr:MAG: hypothetical protein GPOALKHO_000376 [Sodalis sp.]
MPHAGQSTAFSGIDMGFAIDGLVALFTTEHNDAMSAYYHTSLFQLAQIFADSGVSEGDMPGKILDGDFAVEL